MTTKLTLSVERETIERAKRYAREHDRSLSQIVARYLDYLTEDDDSVADIDPEVLDLADEIPLEELGELPMNDDVKYQHLRDKYLHA